MPVALGHPSLGALEGDEPRSLSTAIRNSPRTVTRNPQVWPRTSPGMASEFPTLGASESVTQGLDPLAAGGVLEADRFARGLDHVGMVEQAVDEDGGEAGRHELVEARRMQVRADGDGASLVGGVDEAVQPFGCLFGHRKQADDESAATGTRSPSGGSPPSEVRDYLNVGVLDNLNASPLNCGIT